MDVGKSSRLVEVRNKEASENLPQKGNTKHQALPDDCTVAKVADGDLKADGGGEEDAHQPLQDALELADEDVMQIVAPAEGQTGDEGAHQETGLGIVGGGHQAQEQAQHNGQLDRSAFLLRHLWQDEPIEQAWEPRQGDVSAKAQEQDGRYHGHHQVHDADRAGKGREERQDDEGNHIVDDCGANDELTDGSVDDLALPEDVHGDAQGRRAEAAAGRNGALGVDAQSKGDGYADADGQDRSDDGNYQTAGTDELQHGNVNVDAGLEDQKDQANLSQHDKRLGVGDPAGDGRAQDDPREDLADQAGHLEDALGEGPHHVDEGEEEDGGVQVVERYVDAELGMVLSVAAAAAAAIAVVGLVRHVAGIVDLGLLGQEAVRIRTPKAAEGVGRDVPKEWLDFERHGSSNY
mmetsp:Transcript_10845/g.30476  ORF Transcript_10845/g.30476 Transcript_10845/m.30476 type:complete len:406 (-) Transcript_10845:118-1335(-)